MANFRFNLTDLITVLVFAAVLITFGVSAVLLKLRKSKLSAWIDAAIAKANWNKSMSYIESFANGRQYIIDMHDLGDGRKLVQLFLEDTSGWSFILNSKNLVEKHCKIPKKA